MQQKDPSYRRPRRFKTLAVVGALACLTALLAAALRPRHQPLPPILVLPPLSGIPAQRLSLFDRLVPATPSWAWLWRLKSVIRGKIRAVEIHAEFVTFSNWTPFALPHPDFEMTATSESPGLRIWLLPQPDLASLRAQLRQAAGVSFVNSPRIATGDGIPASLFTGETLVLNQITNEVGVRLSCLACIQGEVTDLTTFASYSTSKTNSIGSEAGHTLPDSVCILTNLDVKARFQIPKGKGIFMLQSSAGTNSSPQAAVMISTKL